MPHSEQRPIVPSLFYPSGVSGNSFPSHERQLRRSDMFCFPNQMANTFSQLYPRLFFALKGGQSLHKTGILAWTCTMTPLWSLAWFFSLSINIRHRKCQKPKLCSFLSSQKFYVSYPATKTNSPTFGGAAVSLGWIVAFTSGVRSITGGTPLL